MSLRSAGLGLRPKAHGAARRFICTLPFNRGIGLLLKLACTLAFRHPPGSWSGFVVDTFALSARVGNIADNCAGGWYGHRAAKTTLNRVIRTTAIEHAGRHRLGVCVAIHPETLVTPLSQPFVRSAFSARLFTPTIATGHSLRVLEGLSLSGDRRVLRLGRIGNPW